MPSSSARLRPTSSDLLRSPSSVLLFLLGLLLALLSPSSTQAFTFAFNQTGPASCDTVEVTWRGGNPPFHLLIIPAFDYPSKHKISNSSYNGETGAYNWKVNYPTDTRFVAVMSDSGGLATGGVSSIMQVVESTVQGDCRLRDSAADGFFFLDPQDGTVGQCQNLAIGWTSNVTNPTLLGVIPNGNAFVLPILDSPWEWPVNVVGSDAQYILAMLDDGPYGQAGSSGFLSVNASKPGSSTACLDAASPSKTPGSQWGTPGGIAATTQRSISATSTSTSGSSPPTGTPHGGLKTPAIVGIAVVSIIAVAACQGVFFWFCCRNRFRRTLASNPVDLFSSKHEGEHVGDAPVPARSRLFGRGQAPANYQPEPYLHVPAGAGIDRHSSPSNDNQYPTSRQAGYDERGEDPFDDDGGYLYAGMVRRGSEGTVGDSRSGSPSQSGINLRSLSSSQQPSPLSPRQSSRPFPAHSDSQGERLLPLRSPSSPSYDTYPSPTYADSPTTTGSSSHLANFSHSHTHLTSYPSSHYPTGISTSSNPSSPLDPSSSGPPSPTMSSTPSMVRNTKQMLALSNPDRELAEDLGPGPAFVRHRDMGPMEEDGPRVARTGETVELPPLYDDLQPRRGET